MRTDTIEFLALQHAYMQNAYLTKQAESPTVELADTWNRDDMMRNIGMRQGAVNNQDTSGGLFGQHYQHGYDDLGKTRKYADNMLKKMKYMQLDDEDRKRFSDQLSQLKRTALERQNQLSANNPWHNFMRDSFLQKGWNWLHGRGWRGNTELPGGVNANESATY